MTYNLPNTLTILRFLLVPFFLIYILQDTFWAKLVSLMIFVVAAITDFLDGKLARLFNQRTEFGKFADPLADKFLVAAALFAFVQLDETLIPFWMVFLILTREFIVTGLRISALSKNMSIETSYLGKVKTTAQMGSILIILLLILIRSYVLEIPGVKVINPAKFWVEYSGNDFWGTVLKYAPLILMTITTLLTVISGVRYLIKYKNVIYGDKK